jgi:hypothetical protein
MAKKKPDAALIDEAIEALGIDTPLYRIVQVDDNTVELTTPYLTVTYSRPIPEAEPPPKPKRRRAKNL